MDRKQMTPENTMRSRWTTCGCLAMAGGGVLLIALLIVGGAAFWFYNDARQNNVGELAFDNQLNVPPLLEPTIDAQDRLVFDLRFSAGQTELLPGTQTPTWGLNGTYLSPTLRATRGDEVVVHVENGVDEPTTLHWHGMRLPAVMDGGPHQLIEPGDTWSPAWTVDQPAATLWFHPHLHGRTANHVYRGAAGLFLLDDDEASALEIPSDYGVDDVPLIIQDKQFHDGGELDDRGHLLGSNGVLGDEILVNGTHAPHFEATTTLVRFRVLNASNARVYNLGFTDGREYMLIGTDSGLLEAPVSLTRLLLSPGERAEIVVRVTPGDEALLRSYPLDIGLDFWNRRMSGADDTFDILLVRGAAQLTDSPALPATLASIDRPEEAEAITTRSFRLSGRSINGESMDMARIDAVVEAGSVEIWEIRNSSGNLHSFHVHDIHFAILDIDGAAPPPHLRGWKDTVFMRPGGAVRIIARFGEHTDPETPYMFHCHILFHEDDGMMGQFVVIEPSSDPPDSIPHARH
ncbi:MAG TPA: multicopper oxidase domain-containing protein [Thermomicrobiales bacterium]|nr:multicopper oxidase domain-containing protein [Thermomicrobiales bacterium]